MRQRERCSERAHSFGGVCHLRLVLLWPALNRAAESATSTAADVFCRCGWSTEGMVSSVHAFAFYHNQMLSCSLGKVCCSTAACGNIVVHAVLHKFCPLAHDHELC